MRRLLRSNACRAPRVYTPRRALSGTPDRAALMVELERQQKEAAELTLPWFVDNMPGTYFRMVKPELQKQHLRAIVALSSPDLTVPEVKLTDKSAYTFISRGAMPASSTKAVTRQLESLPKKEELNHVMIFTSEDDSLSLNIFETSTGGTSEPLFGTNPDNRLAEMSMRVKLKEYASQLRAGAFVGLPNHPPPSAMLSDHQLDLFLSRCTSRYVIQHLPRLLYQQMRLYQAVSGTESVALELEHDFEGTAESLITTAVVGLSPRAALLQGASLLGLHGLALRRAQVDEVRDGKQNISLLRFLVVPEAGGKKLSPAQWNQLAADLKRVKWLDDTALTLAAACPTLGLQRAEVAAAIADLSNAVHLQPLLGRPQIQKRLASPGVQPHVHSLVDLFLSRHSPHQPLADADFHSSLEEWLKGIEMTLGNEETRALLRTMGSAVRHTLRTNVHLDGRSALMLRMDPVFFEPALPPSGKMSNMPFGVFFGAGRHFNGYHVRFRDVARGGLRVVLPASVEAHTAESSRHFNECFSLAWAQQLKNKDIPEGGSKAVCLVEPVPGADRTALLHGCVKRFTDGLLDLITPDSAVKSKIAFSNTQKPEILYLGPDENITPTDINWVVAHAAKRGYPLAAAFMSSKPDAGINHKVYGVTSEGVAVFLDSGLRSLGIDPTAQPWTIKLTGGPDGDVAGNMLKILHREYGSMVRVVGIADGSGCAEDPRGLSMDELLRLVHANLPLSAFDRVTLGPEGLLSIADTPEGAAKRNTMYARVCADAFVPAGGRPSTVNASNWRDILLPDGTPTSRIIVEGANLFLTADARQALFDAVRLPIVKDSSANKCGVICSSMEIVASMALTADEFIQLKEKYVSQVLDRLRLLARLEADLLFKESSLNPDLALPLLSERISYAILRVSDALGEQFDGFNDSQKRRLWPLMREQLPPVLFEKYASRLPEKLPWEYIKNMISSGLAGRLVYREGLQYVEQVPDKRLREMALAYLQQEQHVRKLVAEVAASNLVSAPAVEALLLQGGVRAAVDKQLMKVK